MNPQKLANIKLKLISNRLAAPLFDTPLFIKNLEAVYIKMYEHCKASLEPQDISIA
jgi:predicted O-linked N-acetylglucosamine transferase (SPINDLY family)